MEQFKLRSFPILLFIAIILSACNGNAQNHDTVEFLLLDKQEFKEKLVAETDPQLIDVRTASEFNNGNIEGAKNHDILDGSFQNILASLNKDKSVFVYCAKGGRSGKAAKLLKDNGFKSIIDLKGGYTSWVEE